EEADLVLEENYYFEANTHAPLETHGAVADFGPDGKLTIWSSTQAPHYLHRELAKVLEMPRSHVRVIKPHIGSGFGGKSEPFALEFCSAWLSKKCGRPVKIIYTREEVFLAYRGRHAMKMWLKVGVKKDGSITSIDYKSWLDGGAYGSYGVVTTYYSGQFLTLPYKVPNFRFTATRLYTNKPAAGPKRGHGAVQPRFAIETHLDKIAEKLGLDPVLMRIKNSVEPNSMTVNSLRITSCGFPQACEEAAKLAKWNEKFGKLPFGKGIGFAGSTYISGAGKPIYWNEMPHSGVVTKIDRGGGVAVFCGASDIGQGSDSMLAYVTAEVLGIRPSDVRVCQTDTDLTPVDLGSYSSRVTFMAGNAAIEAATKLKKMLLDVASAALKVSEDELELADNEIFSVKDVSVTMDFVDAVILAETKYGTLSAAGSYKPPKLGGDYKGAGAGPSPSYSFTAAIAEVDVDFETGEVKVTNLITAHDCGKALNPVICEGQVEGSAYMGFGEAVLEQQIITKKGLYWTPSFLEYKLPTIYDTPNLQTILIESEDPEGPFGAKESGEGPLAPSIPAIVNAVYNAIGVRINEVPITAEKILKALEEKRKTENETHKNGKAGTKKTEFEVV
ncbi:molybdopterin-dependent oxidoreductase, partial [bacterium]|nr:molybdopterin-dependent oxidoreductase [bacterium]